MSALETYLKAVSETRGMQRLTALRNLRRYIKQCTEEELLIAIRNIKNYTYLRLLISAGLRTPIRDAVIKQYNTLEQAGEGET